MTEQTLFTTALEQEPNRRGAFLDQACAGNAELRQRVEVLLKAHGQHHDLLDGEGALATLERQANERAGTQIGPYKLLEQVGEGGMGTVWMAQQSEPVKRLVAVKLIKAGMDSRQIIARFDAERQALAMMDHAHIARVLDAGMTGTGRPYFVMDLVRGVPITRYCDDNHLTLRQRLELFVPVCQAIQHAHQKGIIHRDIKPTNVMVTLYDGQPAPRVIDFGVAKATGQKLTERTLFTQYGTLVGTLEYMSPEQAQFNQLDVDTRSDIYSLGVLLYELLTGTTPLEQSRLGTVAFDETLRIIREEEPPKPSTRLSSSERLPTIAANRHTEPARLSKAVRGELDWIVMKALEKDRNRRYATANGLALDLQRYLHNEPVQACPPSALYRFRKFAMRNKRFLAACIVVAVALLLAVGSLGWMLRDHAAGRIEARLRFQSAVDEAKRLRDQKQWADARAAARRAEQLLPPGQSQAGMQQQLHGLLADLEMVDRLERTRLLQTQVKDEWWDLAAADPAYAAEFREYGIDAVQLPAATAAERVRRSAISEQLVAALDDWSFVVPSQNVARREQIRAIVRLADRDEWRNRFRKATMQGDRQALEDLAGWPEVAGWPPATVVLLGRSLQMTGAGGKAIEVLAHGQRRFPTDFWLNMELARMLRWNVKPPRYEEAVGYCRAALAVRPDSAGAWEGLGTTLRLPNHVDEALVAFRTAISLQPDYAEPHHQLGRALQLKREWVEAAASLREAIRLKPNVAIVHADLGRALNGAGDLPGAADAFRRAVALQPGDVNHWALLRSACLAMGDSSAHRQVCKDMVSQFAQTEDANVAAGVVCNCVGVPEVLEDTKPLVRLAYLAGSKKNGLPILGAALYRAGDFQGAVFRLEQANARGPWELLFLAMAHHHLGHEEQARGYLKQATSQIDANRLPLPDSAPTKLLRREAEDLIERRSEEPRSQAQVRSEPGMK